MNLLVTGGAGYIGSHFCKAASSEGHKIYVIDDMSTGHEAFAKWGRLYKHSISDSQKIKSICVENDIEAVVHFAAKSIVSESMRNPDLYQKENVGGTRLLLDALSGTGVKYFVFSSSAATYGEPSEVMISEQTPQRPVNPYGQSKLDCERLLLAQGGLRLAVLRYFNVIGQDPEHELCELHEPETHLVPNIMRALIHRKTFEIYGDDYPTDDGTCVRDYVDVNDLAQVHLAALDYIQKNTNPLISNVGRGQGDSIRDVLRKVKVVFGELPEVKYRERRPGDPPRLVACDKFFRSWCKLPLRSLEESLRNLERD